MKRCSIRPATASDDVIALWRDVYRRQHVPMLPEHTSVPFYPLGTAYVAIANEALAGFCCVDGNWLAELWVAIDWQRCGIGTTLARHAEAVMRNAGNSEAVLTVLLVNKPAIAFYERLGWQCDSQPLCSVTGQPFLRYRKAL